MNNNPVSDLHLLETGYRDVAFIKADGSVRVIRNATRDLTLIPEDMRPSTGELVSLDYDPVVVWCHDEGQYRSFRSDRLLFCGPCRSQPATQTA